MEMKEPQKGTHELTLVGDNRSQTNLISLQDFLHDIKANYPESTEKVEQFLSLIEDQFSENDLVDLSSKFLLQDDILEKYLSLKRLAYRFKVKFSEEDKERLKDVKETISDIKPIFSIKAIKTNNIKENSDSDDILKNRIKKAIKDLDKVSENIDDQIYLLNNIFAVLRELQSLEQKTLEAIQSREGGNVNISGSSTGVDNFLQRNAQLKDSLIAMIQDPKFQLKTDVFMMNKKQKSNDQGGKE